MEDAKNEQQLDSFFSCISLSVYAHLAPNAEGPFPILTFLWQITTATFANHCSTFVNFNSSSQDLCEEVFFPLYRWRTKTSRTQFQKHTVTLNAQCETLRDDVFQSTWNCMLDIQRYHVRKKIVCAHVISTRSWCKHERVIWNFHGYLYVCHRLMGTCVVPSIVTCSQYS